MNYYIKTNLDVNEYIQIEETRSNSFWLDYVDEDKDEARMLIDIEDILTESQIEKELSSKLYRQEELIEALEQKVRQLEYELNRQR